VRKILSIIKDLIGLRETLIISGLTLLGYGLYLYRPWIAFVVIGCLLLAGGFFMGEDNK